jgi:hypothetical protein
VVYTGSTGGGIGAITSFQDTMHFGTRSADAGATDSGAGDADTDGSTEAGSTVDAGTQMDWQNYVADNMTPTPETQSGVVTFSGNQLNFDRTCPSVLMNSLQWQYTNSGNTLLMLTPGTNGSSLLTFVRVGN